MRINLNFLVLFFLVTVYGLTCCLFTWAFLKLYYGDCDTIKGAEYRFRANTDVDGDDLLHVHTNNPLYIKKVCDAFDECQGYNNNGWLKTSLKTHDSNQADFYQKTKVGRLEPFHLSNMQDNVDMIKNMKVYVYQTNIGIAFTPARTEHLAVERIFVQQLLSSSFLTTDPSTATHFFVPTRCSSYILVSADEREGVQFAKETSAKIINEVQTKHPYWSRSLGADHFYICAHDSGGEVSSQMMRNSVALLNSADYRDNYFVPHKDISLPPSVDQHLEDLLLPLKGGATVDKHKREHLAYFSGDLKVGRIRPHIWDLWHFDEDIKLFSQPLSNSLHAEFLQTSKFCLVIRGKNSFSTNLIEAVLAGCIPVLISDYYHLPLQDSLDWSSMSITVPESNVNRLKSILVSVGKDKIASMQKNMEKYYSLLLWSRGKAVPHDAFHNVMLQLWRKRHISLYNQNDVL